MTEMNHKTWLDEMKLPENVDDAVKLIKRLVYYYGGAFCIKNDVFLKKFSFLSKEEDILPIVTKLRCNGIDLKIITMPDNLDKLNDTRNNLYIIYSLSSGSSMFFFKGNRAFMKD